MADKARITLTHAIAALGIEVAPPYWCVPGVVLALHELDKARSTMYCNSTHRGNRCKRCLEMSDMLSAERHAQWLKRQELKAVPHAYAERQG